MDFTENEIKLYSDIVCGTIDIAIRELLIKYDRSIFRKKYYKNKLNELYNLQYEKCVILGNMIK